MPSKGLSLTWDGQDQKAWDAALAAAGRSTLEQSWAYGAGQAASRGALPRRGLIERDGRARAVVQVLVKRGFLPLDQARILRGPLFCDPALDAAERAAILALVRRQFSLLRRELLIWMPELADGPESQALMRACGTRRMVTGYSSLIFDLARPAEALRAELRGAWRRDLAAAERSGLPVQAGGAGPTLDWLVDRAEAQRRAAGYLGPSALELQVMAASLDRPEAALLLLTAGDPDPIAGVLFLRHGLTATYLLGWSGEEGRQRHAHNLLLWQGLLELQRRGLAWLDLGVVNAVAAPGLARFKLGMGGKLLTLAGTFI